MRKLLLAFAAPIVLSGAPLRAQEIETATEAGELDGLTALFDMFEAKPLTPEQEARMPAAIRLVDQAFPAGTYRKMMETSLDPMTKMLNESFLEYPKAEIAEMAGLDLVDVEALDERALSEIMAILDPAFEERGRLSNTVMSEMMIEVAEAIEPAYRQGLARAYAVRFSESELADIAMFFATPTGRKYAPESVLLYSDPQVMSVMGEAMPAFIERIPTLAKDLETRVAHLPAPRKVTTLTGKERERLASLLKVRPQDLRDIETDADDGE